MFTGYIRCFFSNTFQVFRISICEIIVFSAAAHYRWGCRRVYILTYRKHFRFCDFPIIIHEWPFQLFSRTSVANRLKIAINRIIKKNLDLLISGATMMINDSLYRSTPLTLELLTLTVFDARPTYEFWLSYDCLLLTYKLLILIIFLLSRTVTTHAPRHGKKMVHIFEIPDPNLLIHFVTFMALRRRFNHVIGKK